jgi:tetratricopeptide (TPR) repeat protein
LFLSVLIAAPFCFAQTTPAGNAAEWNRRGNLALSRGDYPGAELCYRNALDLAPDSQSQARIWSNLALAWKRQRRWHDSVSAYEQSLRLGAGEPHRAPAEEAITLSNLAETLCHMKETARAAQLMKAALDRIESMPGPPLADLAAVLNNFGVIKGRQGYYTAGARMLERSLAIKRSLYGPAHPETVLTETNLAGLRRDAASRGGPSPHRVDIMELRASQR